MRSSCSPKGSGIVVPHEDPGAIAAALRTAPHRPGAPPRVAAAVARVAGRLAHLGERRAPLRGASRGRFARAGARPADSPGSAASRTSPRSPTASALFEHALLRDAAAGARLLHRRRRARARRRRREPEQPGRPRGSPRSTSRFLEQAQLPDGRFHNRRSAGPGRRLDRRGRLGRLAGPRALRPRRRGRAARRSRARRVGRSRCFERGRRRVRVAARRARTPRRRSAPPRSRAHPGNAGGARALRAVAAGSAAARRPGWPWPEPRLAYDNARLAEARIAAGRRVRRAGAARRGPRAPRWLVDRRAAAAATSASRPTGGWAPGEPRPGFDQQPIEAGAMADACARAFEATGRAPVRRARRARRGLVPRR